MWTRTRRRSCAGCIDLEWMTREEELKAAAHVPYRLLEEVPELSYTAKDEHTENMLIQGDNAFFLASDLRNRSVT
jgi:hypothetical protein